MKRCPHKWKACIYNVHISKTWEIRKVCYPCKLSHLKCSCKLSHLKCFHTSNLNFLKSLRLPIHLSALNICTLETNSFTDFAAFLWSCISHPHLLQIHLRVFHQNNLIAISQAGHWPFPIKSFISFKIPMHFLSLPLSGSWLKMDSSAHA